MPIPPKKEPVIDVEGSDIVSRVLLELLNDFPGLDGKKVTFSTLEETSGIGFFPSTGAVLESNRESITGHVFQRCAYPFSVVYRSAPKTEVQKMRVKEYLDALGRWLEQQPVTIKDTEYRLDAYPELEAGRTIRSIHRTSPAHLNAAYQDGIEDWTISATLRYEAEYDK